MTTPSTRRRKWMKISAGVAVVGALAVITLQIWISVFAPHPLAAVRGIAWLVMCVGISASGAVCAVFLKLTDSPILTNALKLLSDDTKPKLRVIEGHQRTGS